MNVLEQDRELAEKIWGCGCLYLDYARVAWVNGQFDEADRWVEEYRRCRRELDELLRRKREHDQLAELIATLQERGINITAIIGKGNE
ncbi:hypothetical protein ACPVTF_04010 [Geobacillus icigianus]|uniref:Uncharacterized protein n=1 Tax=Geobacillus subterraneus TaxID=129338 RepID=A0A679FQF8_9BACL|nr:MULTISPECIES: hypothetical protein [Geobacillus]BBW97259.1 hypothetical protein GsuE55_20920 [Geobacillus subterraneus]